MIKLTIEEKAKIFGLSKEYYKRCKDRKKYEKYISNTLNTITSKIITLLTDK